MESEYTYEQLSTLIRQLQGGDTHFKRRNTCVKS